MLRGTDRRDGRDRQDDNPNGNPELIDRPEKQRRQDQHKGGCPQLDRSEFLSRTRKLQDARHRSACADIGFSAYHLVLVATFTLVTVLAVLATVAEVLLISVKSL